MLTPSNPVARHIFVIASLLVAIGCGAKQDPVTQANDAGSRTNGTGGTDSGDTTKPVTNPTTPVTSDPSDDDDDEVIIGADQDAASSMGATSSIDSPEASFLCGSSACTCSDGVDNDGDGATDGMDQECTGPLDNDEGTFATGIPGDNRDPKWQDCFFDGNSGAGDDGCRYHTDCLTGDAPSDADECTLTQACIDFCRPLTPPGCDCFGCCDVPFEGTTIGVKLSDTCSIANLDDEVACPRCTTTDNCENECGECELCLGKTLADLPESCGTSEPPGTNDGGSPTDPNVDAGEGQDAGSPDTTNDEPDTTDDGSDPETPAQPPNTCDMGAPCQATSDCAAGDYCRLGCCVDYTPQVL